jgi:hypothetical protein
MVLLDILGLVPVGTFDVKISICNVIPEQQSAAGAENVDCYDITYNKPKEICNGKNDRLSLVQALSSGSWYNPAGLSPFFDCYNHKDNKGKKFPDYIGQSDSAGNMKDSPIITSAEIWNATVCAKCAKCINNKIEEEILGCISFQWNTKEKNGLVQVINHTKRLFYSVM